VTVKRLNRYEVTKIQWLSGIENFCKRDDFIFISFRNFKLVKRFQNRSDVLEFWSLKNSSCKSILDALETIYLIFRKTIVQRVTVLKLGVYDGGGNCFGVYSGEHEFVDSRIYSRLCRDLIGQGQMFVKYEAKVASRLSSVY